MYSTALDLEDYNEKEEQLHHVELQLSQRKKERKKFLRLFETAFFRSKSMNKV